MYSLLLVELGLCGGINCEILVDLAKELCRVHGGGRHGGIGLWWCTGWFVQTLGFDGMGQAPCLPNGLARESSER